MRHQPNYFVPGAPNAHPGKATDRIVRDGYRAFKERRRKLEEEKWGQPSRTGAASTESEVAK